MRSIHTDLTKYECASRRFKYSKNGPLVLRALNYNGKFQKKMPSHSLFVCSPFQMLPDEVYECSSRSPRDRYKLNLRKHPTVVKALKGTVTLTWGQSVYLYFFTSALHVSIVISLCFMDCYNKLWNMSKELRVLPTAPSQTK